MKYCKEAISFSKKGEHKLHKIGAVIARKNIIISQGYNKMKTHPRSTHAFKHIHAEMDAIFKAGQKCVGSDLYVARIGNNGLLNNARPCPACLSLIIAAGIKRIFYTDNNSWNELKI